MALKEKDVRMANELIGWEEIVTRAVDQLDVAGKQKREIIRGGLAGARTVPSTVAEVLKDMSYRFVGVKEREGGTYVLFRIDSEEAFNYHLLRLAKIRGRVRADEFHVALTGEEMAETFRKNLAMGLNSQSIVGRLSGAQKQFLDDLKLQKAMSDAINSGEEEKALGIYQRMPERLKKMKMPMLFRIMATPVENEEAYIDAVESFLKIYPNDGSAGMNLLDAGVLRKDAKLVMKAYKSLSSWTGGDPELDLTIGANLLMLDEVDKAIELTKDIDPATIGTEDAHDYKLTIALAIEDNEEALKQLRIFRDQFGYEFSDLHEAEGFEAFVKSDQFKEWLAETEEK